MSERRITPDNLEAFLVDAYLAVDMPRHDAVLAAKFMTLTNLWGIDSQGVLRLPAYLARLRKRVVNPSPEIRSRDPSHVSLPIDILHGDDGLGYVVGHAGMREAMEKARRFGVGMVVTVRSNHYGAAGLYARMASDAGMIGFSTTNAMPNMGLADAARPVVGDNPVAVSAPVPGCPPFTLDVAMSSAGEGGGANGAAGTPAGILRPLGMHKGLGLALAAEILTGALAGDAFLGEVRSERRHPDVPSLNSHLFVAVEPDLFVGRDRFADTMRRWREHLEGASIRVPGACFALPGETEAKEEDGRRRNGIPLPEKVVGDLAAVAAEYGVREAVYN